MGASCAKYLKKASKTSQSSSLKSEPNCLKKERKTFAKSVFTSKGPLFIFPNRSASSNRTGNNRNAAEKRGFTEYASGEGVREHGAEHGEKPRRGDQHQWHVIRFEVIVEVSEQEASIGCYGNGGQLQVAPSSKNATCLRRPCLLQSAPRGRTLNKRPFWKILKLLFWQRILK